MNLSEMTTLIAEAGFPPVGAHHPPATNLVERLDAVSTSFTHLPHAPVGPCLIYSDDRQTRAWLIEDILQVGRHEDCDITIDNTHLSRRHINLRYEANGTVHLEVLTTKNSVSVNGKPVSRAILASGDQIRTAGLNFLFVSPEPGALRHV